MFLSDPPLTEQVRAKFDRAAEDDGYVANYLRLWAWRADIGEQFAELRGRLMDTTTLDERERALIVTAAVSALGDSYCSLAWGTRLADLIGNDGAAEIVRQREARDLTARERALAQWVRKVAADPNATTAADVDALRAAGLRDREIFEATVLTAFRLAFSIVNDALGASPDPKVHEEAPPELKVAVDFGRAPAR